MTFNVMDLAEAPGKYSMDRGMLTYHHGPILKPEWQIEGVFRTIQRVDPDFFSLEEVQTLSALNLKTKRYLNDNYYNILVPGNDALEHNITLSFKKDLPIKFEVLSNRDRVHRYLGEKKHLFPRDLPVVIIKDLDDHPIAAFVLVHHKSKNSRGKSNHESDPESFLKRSDGVKVQLEVIQAIKQEYPGIPVFSAGDHNADLRSAPEFKPLWNAGMVDLFTLLKVSEKNLERVTQCFFPMDRPSVYSQLDGILLDAETAARPEMVRSGGRVNFTDKLGRVFPLPKSYEERKHYYSDHFPLAVQLNLWNAYQDLLARSH